MKKLLFLIFLSAITVMANGQTKPKHKIYHIKYVDTVNIYNDKTVLIIKDLKGGFKYIVVRATDQYTIQEANVVNYYK